MRELKSQRLILQSSGLMLALFTSTMVPVKAVYAGVLHVRQNAIGFSCTQHDPCPTVQQAVDNSVTGDKIIVHTGTYTENIFIETAGIIIRGISDEKTVIVAAGGREGAVGNAGNPLNAVIEIRAPNVSLKDLALIVPAGKATKRDAGVFAWPGSTNLSITNSRIERLRDLRIDEPTVPGSRGVFVLLSRNSRINNNRFYGNYEDHVHLPSGGIQVRNNLIVGAARAGVSVMSPDFDPNFPADNNRITENQIFSSIDAGIHIQGDNNFITKNRIENNGGYGIYLCGPADSGCYPPGANATSEDNLVRKNIINQNSKGKIADFGSGNRIIP